MPVYTDALFTYNIYYFTIIQLRWLLIGGLIFDDYINRCILYETKKEIVAFRLERFYTIYYKSILGLNIMRESRTLEYNRLILEGCNQTFEEITSFNQQLTFAKLETEFMRVMGIEKINKDILKTLELYSDQSGFNNAAALLADDNQFTGIDIIRFGDTIDEIMDRESLENISILSQLEKTLQMFRKYYRKCVLPAEIY